MPQPPKKNRKRYVPVRVEDMPALDAAIAEYLARGGLSEDTLRAYERNWRVWVEFCSGRGFADPLNAPIEAFRAFVAAAGAGQLRRPGDTASGKPMQTASLDVALAAVRWMYSKHGCVNPVDLPEHREQFRRLRAGYGVANTRPAVKAKPLTADDMRALLSARPPLSSEALGRVAFVLAALDSGLALEPLRACTLDDLVLENSDTVAKLVCDGNVVTFECDHRERVVDLPHPCTVCALRDLRADLVANGHDGQDHLFSLAYHVGRVRLWHSNLASAWPCLARPEGWSSPAVALRADLGEWCQSASVAQWLAAGTRLALTVAQARYGLSNMRCRALLAVSWPVGLRMGSDVRLMRRCDVQERAERWSLHIARSKGDQGGAGRTYGLSHATDTGLCPIKHLVPWLAVRDAGLATEGYNPADDETAFCAPVFQSWFSVKTARSPIGRDALRVEFNSLQKLAECEGFSLHSARTGFAEAATEQGHGLMEIQATLGHTKPETTMGYIRSGSSAAAARKLMAGLTERAPDA